MKKILIIILWAACQTGWSDDFVNLTFDQPDLSHVESLRLPGSQDYRDYAPVEEGLRGWTVSEPMRSWIQESPSQGRIDVASLVAPTTPISLYLMSISGLNRRYGMAVSQQLSSEGGLQPRPTFQLTQTGRVPEEAVSLRFYDGIGSMSPVFALINGHPVDARRDGFVEIDLLPFAGQEIELSFEFPEGQSHLFDIIGFQTIPEPSPITLLVVGSSLLLAGRRRTRVVPGNRHG